MSDFENLRSRALNQPLLLTSGYARVICGALQGKFKIGSLREDGEKLTKEDLEQERLAYVGGNSRAENAPYRVMGKTAVIPVEGTLVNRYGYLRPYSGMTGYDGIRANIEIALADEQVEEAVLLLRSGGGEVSGCFELCDFIKSKTDEMKITALVDDIACSACYAIASSCSEILVSATSTIGSIGVITLHASYEKALEQQGIEITIFKAGEHKAELNPYRNLSDDTVKRVQAEINQIWDMFASRVAANRNMSVEDIKAMNALTFMGSNAIEKGLADKVVSALDYLTGLLSPSGSSDSTTRLEEGSEMSANKDEKATKVEANASAAVTANEANEVTDKQLAEAKEQGAKEMQSRIFAIIDCEQAEGREKFARHLASKTNMSVEEAVSMLEASPKEAKAEVETEQSVGEEFKAAMAEQTAEPIGLDVEDESTKLADENSAEFALEAYKNY